MDTIMSTLTWPGAAAALAHAKARAPQSLLQRLLWARLGPTEGKRGPSACGPARRARLGNRGNQRPAPGPLAAAGPAPGAALGLTTPRQGACAMSALSGCIAQTQPHAAGPRRLERARGAWALATRVPYGLIAAWAEWRRVRRAVRQLEDLSDRMLADIGLQRSDIDRVARYGRGAIDERSILAGMP